MSLKEQVWNVLFVGGPANTLEITHRVGASYEAVRKCLRRMENAKRVGPGLGGRGCVATWFLPDPTEPIRMRPRRKRKPLIEKTECVVCGTTKKLLVHHIDGNHGNDEPANLEVVCKSCHGRLHWARRVVVKAVPLLRLPANLTKSWPTLSALSGPGNTILSPLKGGDRPSIVLVGQSQNKLGQCPVLVLNMSS